MNSVPPRAVLFDLDNTLVHRARSIEAYAGRFRLDFGDRLDPTDDHEVAARILEQDHGGYLAAGSPHRSIQEAVASTLARELRWRSPVDAEEIRRHWRAQLPVHSVEMPGAAAVVAALARRGVRIGIVSNGAERSRAATLASLPWRHHVGAMVSSERAGTRKPEAAIFHLAARELGTTPDACWFVGDHPDNDVAGAERAGMTAVWLRGFHPWSRDEPPRRVIDDLAELARGFERGDLPAR